MFNKISIPEIFILLLWSTLLWNLRVSRASYNALFVICNSQEDFCTPIDRETFNRYKPECSGILSACQNEVSQGNVCVLHSVTAYSANHSSLNPVYCSYPLKPSPVTSSGVGYYLERTNELEKMKPRPPSTSPEAPADAFLVSVYEIDTDKEKIHTTRTKHRISSYEYFVAAAYTKTCQDFSRHINDVFAENEEIAKYYSEYRRKYSHEGSYFVPVQLTPIGDFTDDASRKATCTLYNTVPLWATVAKGPLRKLEIYIRHVADILKAGTLEVTTISNGILRLPKSRIRTELQDLFNGSIAHRAGEEDEDPLQDVYLDPHRSRLPVPEILIKILCYRVSVPILRHDHEQDGEDAAKYKNYCIAFVIHNALDGNRIERICETDVCRKYGWLVIRPNEYERWGSKFYCCAMDDSKLQKVVEFEYDGEPFDLNSLPIELDEKGRIERKVVIPPLGKR